MRFYKTYSFSRNHYLVEENSKKCTECLRKRVLCDLYFSLIIIKRVYDARVKIRKKIREARVRLFRLEQQFKRLEDKEKDMIKIE